ncbi:MAG: alpha/beta hydrolase [Pseudomonadota bacterium]
MLLTVLTGIGLLCGALWVFSLWRTHAVERAFPVLGDRLSLNGGDLHVVERGNGIPVVMLHGASGNLRDWTASIFDDVAGRHRAVAVDRPGHGWSDSWQDGGHDPRRQAAILHDAFQRLGIERPVLVGHSFAGTVVLAYALRYPENTGGILFLSGVSHPWPGGVGRHHEIAALPVVGALFAHLCVPLAYLVRAEAAVRSVFHPNRPPTGYADKTGIALYSRPSAVRTNARELTRLKPIVMQMEGEYRAITAPLIALTGDSDGVIYTHLHTPPLVDKVPGAELRVLDTVGHCPHHVAPEAVLTAIDDLVRRRVGAAAEIRADGSA